MRRTAVSFGMYVIVVFVAGVSLVLVVVVPYRAGWSCLDVVIIDSAPQ